MAKEIPTIKIPYKIFIEIAMMGLKEKYPIIPVGASPIFMKEESYGSSSQCYETPEYVEIEIKAE